MKYLSLFSGIGSPEQALENLDIDYELVGFSEIDKYAIKSYCAIHDVKDTLNLGDITKIDIENLPLDIDLITHGSPCLTGDTLVLTKEGYRKIKDLKINDFVLSHDNNYHKIINTINQGQKEIWKIKAMALDEINATCNHKFYVRKKAKRIWDNKKQTNERVFNPPEWVECKDLNMNYYLGLAINNESQMPKWEGVECTRGKNVYIKNNLPLEDNRFWYLCGRFLGDGWVKTRKDRNNNISGTIICCGKHEVEELKSKIGDLFKYTLVEDRTTFKFQFSNKELASFLSQFGKGAANKFVPGFVIDLPVNYLSCFLDGYFDSDGSDDCKNNLKATSISRELMYGIGQCIAKVYKRPYAIYKNKRPKQCKIEDRIVNQHDTYQIKFTKERHKQDHAFYEDGYIWYPIASIENTHSYKETYDISVEDSESFVANGCIVHNCQDFSVAGKGQGADIGTGTRSSLMWNTVAICKHCQPKYVIWENVKNVLSKKHRHNFDKYLEEMDRIGYDNHYKILNSKYYGVPQNRERVFVVSIRKDLNQTFEFSEGFDNGIRLRDILEDKVDEKFYINNEKAAQLIEQYTGNLAVSHEIRSRKFESQGWKNICPTLCARDYKGPKNIICPVITPDRLEKRQNGRRFKENDEPMFTTTTQDRHGILEAELDLVGNLEGNYEQNNRVYSEDGICPTLMAGTRINCTGGYVAPKILTNEIIEVGMLDKNGYRATNKVLSTDGICTCLDTMQGGHREPKIVCEQRSDEGLRFFKGDYCGTLRTIDACGDKRVIEPINNSEAPCFKVKQATKLGYDIAQEGDSINLEQPNSSTRRGRVGKESANTLTTSCNQAVVQNYRIRKLTPRECWRLMAFSDEAFDKAAEQCSNSQLYKQAGNSIVVSVMQSIFINLFKED